MLQRLFPGILLFASPLFAQTGNNLVPNPSFEKYKTLPTNVGEGKTCLSEWVVPVAKGGGDYYHADAKNEDANTEHNYFGGQSPHSGKAYAGFCVTTTYREYLQVQLIQALVKGQRYTVSFYISSGDKIWLAHLKEIGVLFTSRMMTIPFGKPMYEPPQILFWSEEGYTDSKGWTLLSTEFVADGSERCMTIGAFEWKSDTPVLIDGKPHSENPPLTGAVKDVHYFVDDVSVIAVTDSSAVKSTSDSLVVSADTVNAFQTGQTIVLRNILFENNSAALQAEAGGDLDKVADWMNAHPSSAILISGHTDNNGDAETNRKLSEERAAAVKNYLVKKGVAASRIVSKGFGETMPVAPNDTPEGREKNRRVEISFE